MDTAVFYESGRLLFSFLLIIFVPGFALSLVIFPRLADLSIMDRLVYATVMGISSCIATVVFIDIVPGLEVTVENFALVISCFSLLVLLAWSAERYYLNRRLKKQEPKILKDNPEREKYNTRAINATKDRFRKDTRTMVIYHESWKSGLRHIGHSFLMDAGEEIDIQQIAENKLDDTDSYIVDPPYPKTRYFEVVILEYNDNGSSQIDDLQIYPVHVTKNPKRREKSPALQNGTLQITKRIYQKSSTSEVQWIYSHDFHIFAILHAEDTLDQMVDLILWKLDEIVTSLKGGIQSSSSRKDPHMVKNAFDTEFDGPSNALSQPVYIPEKLEIQQKAEQKERMKSPEFQPRVLPVDIQKRQELQTNYEPKHVSLHSGVHHQVLVKDSLKHPENKLVVDSIRKLQKDILRDLDMFNLTTESFKRSRKNIENIQIPKKADVHRKLAEAKEEMRDLDWLYE